MASSTKYSVILEEDENIWTANVVRRASRKELIVSKTETGFKTEEEAQAWGDEALKEFVEQQTARNKRHNEKR
ncbi:DUF3622 domain-containing protein [Leucothrix sargassi]|nr:DUF3622 domain-containing protein [Leucothrix sargassi]